jgi:DNA replication and repair protein RecF
MEMPFSKQDKELLDVYDFQLAKTGRQILQKRQDFTAQFTAGFNELYQHISLSREPARMEYRSKLEEVDFEELLFTNREPDRLAGRTTQGIHKDDLVFRTKDYLTKKHASQGQQKSFVLALKLAQYHLIAEKGAVLPFLLLDDLFDRLDQDRIDRLMEWIKSRSIGQTFITDTDPKRLSDLLPDAEVKVLG